MNRTPSEPFVLPPTQDDVTACRLILERQELRDRLGKALDTCRDMAENSRSDQEWRRLTAKAEGIGVAISYLDEYLRR